MTKDLTFRAKNCMKESISFKDMLEPWPRMLSLSVNSTVKVKDSFLVTKDWIRKPYSEWKTVLKATTKDMIYFVLQERTQTKENISSHLHCFDTWLSVV